MIEKLRDDREMLRPEMIERREMIQRRERRETRDGGVSEIRVNCFNLGEIKSRDPRRLIFGILF